MQDGVINLQLVQERPHQILLPKIFLLPWSYCPHNGHFGQKRQVLPLIGLNQLTVSVMVIGVMIMASLMVLVSFYCIFMEMLTDKRRRVEKIYQKRKRGSKREVSSVTIIQVR